MGDRLGLMVRRFRRRAGLTQEALAERSGLSVRTIRALESGKQRNPQVGSLRQLAGAMELCSDECDDLVSTTLVADTLPSPRQLPAAARGFAGRELELADLDRAVTSEGSMGVIATIAGAGGIGKTWLALRWAHQNLERFPDGQLFVDLRGFTSDNDPLDPLTAVRGFLEALGVEPARMTGGLAEHAALYRSQVAGKRMLILLDNAANAEQVIPLLPGTPSCTVLVTSRQILTALLHRHSAHHLALTVFDDVEAHILLAQRLGGSRIAGEPDAVAGLIAACGRHPMALAIAAGRAHARRDIPLAEFTAELGESGLDALDDSDPTTSLPAVLSWSLRALTAPQRTVFALLGIAPGPDIGLPAAASLTGLPPAQARKVLRELEDASLVHRQAADRYSMHGLIRAYALATAKRSLTTNEWDAALRRVIEFYLHTAHAADHLVNARLHRLRLDPPAAGIQPCPLSDVSAALAWFDAEHANLLASHHAAVTGGWHKTASELVWALTPYNFRCAQEQVNLVRTIEAGPVWDAAAIPSRRQPADPTYR